MEIHGFIQVYYRTGDPLTKDGYRLRKGDLKFSGQVSPNIRWRVGFDAAKVLQLTKTSAPINDTLALLDVALDQRTRILQDAALTWIPNRYLAVDIGQQIVPLSLEGTISTSKVETVERTMFIVERSRATGLGDVRDIGVSANGTLPQGLEYHIGMFNETGESAYVRPSLGLRKVQSTDRSAIAACASGVYLNLAYRAWTSPNKVAPPMA